jgi:uncharacterized metal-binding protein YceD (DUF177 family)
MLSFLPAALCFLIQNDVDRMTPEFSRLIAIDRVPPEGLTEELTATEDERRALAERFGLNALHELSALLRLEPWRRGGVKVTGRFEARVEQTCVVTLEPFEQPMSEEITRYFAGRNSPGPTPVVRSVESLGEDEPEIISGGSIDLGELVAESFGLALDPYPRKPGAEFKSAAERGDEPRMGPFAGLKSLKAGPKGRGG